MKCVCGAAVRLSVQPVVAAIGFHAIKPDQPGTYHIIDFCDLAGRNRRLRGVGVGADPVAIGRGEGGGFRIADDGDLEVIAQGGAIGGRVGVRVRKS